MSRANARQTFTFCLQGRITIPISEWYIFLFAGGFEGAGGGRPEPTGCSLTRVFFFLFFSCPLTFCHLLYRVWPPNEDQSSFRQPLSLRLMPSRRKYWLSAQQTSSDYSARLGPTRSEVGGLEGREAEMLTKCIFLAYEKVSGSIKSFLFAAFLHPYNGWFVLSPGLLGKPFIFFGWGGVYLEIKGPIYLQFLRYCRTGFFTLK